MAPILSVCYDLRPPTSTSASPNLSSTKTHEIPLQVTNSQPGSGKKAFNAYYTALRSAVAEAKDVTGRELTEWRDAVGDGEKEKTGGKGDEVDEEGGGEVEGEEDHEGGEVEVENR